VLEDMLRITYQPLGAIGKITEQYFSAASRDFLCIAHFVANKSAAMPAEAGVEQKHGAGAHSEAGEKYFK
jgi:hypothetical protein